MSNDDGMYVEITQGMIEEFVELYVHPDHNDDELTKTKKKDVRSAFIQWLHLEHGRYKKNITNATAADLYWEVLDRGAPYADEGIDADGDAVFVGIDLSDPEKPAVRLPRTRKTTQERPLANKPIEDLTSQDLSANVVHIFEKIHAFEQKNPLFSGFFSDIVVDILIHSIARSHLNTQEIYVTLDTLRDEIREFIEEVVEVHVEFQSDELKRRHDRRLARIEKLIDDINRWRDRFED